MKFTQRARGIVQAIAVTLALALPLMSAAISPADARIGGGFSSGSRGARTFSAPPSTSTAPSVPRSRSTAPSPSRAARAWARRCGRRRLLQPARPRPARRPRRGLPRRWPVRDAVRRRPVRRARRIFVDLRPDPADRPDRLSWSGWRCHGGSAVMAPAYAGGRGGPGAARRASAPERVSDWDRAARRSKSRRPTMRPSSGCSARSRPRGRTRISPGCTRWRRRKWCRISPAISSRTGPATSSTRCPTSSCCRATSPKPGARAIPIMPASRCGFRWSTRRSTAPPAGWSRAARQPTEATEVWTFVRPRGGNWDALGDPADQLIVWNKIRARRCG